MPVDDQDSLETVVCETATNIFDIADKGVPGDGQSAVEVHVVRAVAVRYGWGEYCLLRDLRDSAFADSVAQDYIGIDRQMGSVVFVCRDGQDRDAALCSRVPGLVPNHFGIAIFHSLGSSRYAQVASGSTPGSGKISTHSRDHRNLVVAGGCALGLSGFDGV